jgi:hypothetical protein
MKELALFTYVACFSGDAITSHYALTQPGVHERLFTQQPVVNDVLIAGQAIGLYAATTRIQRSKLRWTIRLSIAAIHGGAAIYNLQRLATRP